MEVFPTRKNDLYLLVYLVVKGISKVIVLIDEGESRSKKPRESRYFMTRKLLGKIVTQDG